MPIRFLSTAKPYGEYPIAESQDIQHGDKRLNTVLTEINTVNASKADKTYVDSELAKKANNTTVNDKADKTYVDAQIATKASTNALTEGLATKADNSTVSALAGRVSTNETNIANLSNYVTPQMYGAIGDGVTDDTNAFERAISSIQYGGTLFIPKGNYLVSIDANWDGSKDSLFPYWAHGTEKSFTIMGEGSGSKLIAKNNYALNIAYTTIQGQMRTKTVNIKNLSIDGNGKKHGLMLESCGFINIDNVNITGTQKSNESDGFASSSAIKIKACGEFRISGQSVIDISSGCGIHTSFNSSDSVITECNIKHGDVGIYLEDTGCVFITNNIIYGQKKSCVKMGGTDGDYGGVIVSHNELELSSDGSGASVQINTGETDTNTCSGLAITSNYFWVGEYTNGIEIGKSRNDIISNNMFKPVRNSGVKSNHSCIKIIKSFSGIYCNNTFESVAESGRGIDIAGGTGITVKGNSCGNILDGGSFIYISGANDLILESNICNSIYQTSYFIRSVNNVLGGLRMFNNIKTGPSKIETVSDIEDKFLDYTGVHCKNGFEISNGRYDDGPLKLGTYYFWVDNDNKVRYKSGKPSSHDDGSVLVG